MPRFAVIVGVEKYAHYDDTPYAHADAALLEKTLVECCDYLPQDVTTLKLTPDVEMTPEDLLYQISSAVKSSKEGDTVLFYFAGHGVAVNDEPYLLLPRSQRDQLDRTALPLRNVSDQLRQRSRVCVRLFDACHSGTDVRDGNAVSPRGFLEALESGPASDGWLTIAACGADEKSYPDATLGHGIFTHFLCEYIEQLAPGSEIIPELLKVAVTDRVSDFARQKSRTQTPTLIAAIRGNVRIGMRRAPLPKVSAATPEALTERISRIDAIPGFSDERLGELLTVMRDEVEATLKSSWPFEQAFTANAPCRADDVPDDMKKPLVLFAREYQSRHTLRAVVEEVEDYPFGMSSAMAMAFGTRKRKQTTYEVGQDYNMPRSMVLMEGEPVGRCVPAVQLLVYVIPLQIRACLLVSTYHLGWLPEVRPRLVCNYYKLVNSPCDDADAKKRGRSAVIDFGERMMPIVTARADSLCREMALGKDKAK